MKKIFTCVALLMGANAMASSAAPSWVFAHRANTESAIEAANTDGVNAVEIDVTLGTELSPNLGCTETWCAHHNGDSQAVNLSKVLNAVKNSQHIDAVWFDVKTTSSTQAGVYDNLAQVVKTTLGQGVDAPRKFWGVWPASEMNTPYTQAIKNQFNQLGGNSENQFIIEVDNHQDAALAQAQCSTWGMQCGLSSGNPFFGDFPLLNAQNVDFVDAKLTQFSHINSVYFWTFNWNGLAEDKYIDTLFQARDVQVQVSLTKSFCGQEGNGVIVGHMASVYSAGFCDVSNGVNACDFSMSAINDSSSVTLGDRSSNIGEPRNAYLASDCK